MLWCRLSPQRGNNMQTHAPHVRHVRETLL
ncbi:GDP-mannose pyrophosphatase, partial [Klebsiella sp. E-Nf3]